MQSEFTHGQGEYTSRMAAIVFSNLSSILSDCKSDSGHGGGAVRRTDTPRSGARCASRPDGREAHESNGCCRAPGMALYWMEGKHGKS